MKKLLLVLVLVPLFGCAADKSAETQTMAPVNGKAYDAPSKAVNSSVPEGVKSNIPGAKP